MKVITTAKAQWTKELANASVFNANYNIDQGTETDHNEFHLVLTEDEDYPIQLFFRLNTEYFCYGYPASKCCSTLEDFLRSDYVVKALMFYYMENDHDLKDSIELADWYKNRIHEVAPFDLEDLKQACIKDEHYHNYDDIEEELEEEKSTPMYDGEFIDHVEKIWRERHKTILVELSGEKYVINGLFDNEDVIIDCYVADTMQRIDRYFIVGAQQKSCSEAECYCEHFSKRIVKDRNINECWFLTERQFKFLKEA